MVNKALFIFMGLYLLISCSISPPMEYEWVLDENISSIDEALLYIHTNTFYKEDNTDFWQYPEETNELGTGDCEDLSALLVSIIINNVGIQDTKLVVCRKRPISRLHIMVRIEENYYESTNSMIYENYDEDFRTEFEMNLDEYIIFADRYRR